MNSNAIPKKRIELSALQTSSMTMRRLFILMDGKRTLGEITKLCRINEAECEELFQTLMEDGSVSAEGFMLNEDSNTSELIDSTRSFIVECSGFQDCLTKELSLFIGPVAKIIISKVGADKTSLPFNVMDQIVNKVAEEIEKPEDKTAFIEIMHERINQKVDN